MIVKAMPNSGVHGSRCQCLRSRSMMIQLWRRVLVAVIGDLRRGWWAGP